MTCAKHTNAPVVGYSDCPGCEVERLQAEVDAWRERFPQHEYRRIDDCIDLKFSHFQKP
jgi:hypothetical protein